MNTSKYIALALASPAGLSWRAKVEEAWPQWLQHVEDAPWLRNFRDSPLLKIKTRARTPWGAIVDGWPRYPHHGVADAIFSTVVWGFGVEQRHWTEDYWKQQCLRLCSNYSVGIYGRNGSRREVGFPVMFQELDDWLESL